MGTPLFSSRLNINIATTTHRDCSASPVTIWIHGSKCARDSGCMKAFKNCDTGSSGSFQTINSSGRGRQSFWELVFQYYSLARQSLCNICPFYKPSYPIFATLLSAFFLNLNTEIETVSGLICSLPVHQPPRCLDKFYALCSANIKTVLGTASRSLIKNSLIKSSCKM